MSSDAITELEALLREEREAIRQLDSARVLAYAERKQALVESLKQQGGGTLSEENATRLRAIAPALRHNSVLLAHARDVLRDALVAVRADVGPVLANRPRPAGVVPRMISVRG